MEQNDTPNCAYTNGDWLKLNKRHDEKNYAARKCNAIELYALLNEHATPCGSRSVLENMDLDPNTDYDFFISQSEQSSFKEFLMNTISNDHEYLEFPPSYRGIDTIGLYRIREGDINFEITVKRDEYIHAIHKMWNVLQSDPELFERKFWKKKVQRKDIQKNIQNLLELFM